MSKCQVNKYRPGGRCGGDAPKQTSNPEFNSSLASLLQQRERQDAMFTGAPAPAAAPAAPVNPQKNQVAIVETKPKATALDKQAYIQLVLDGDYED
jgi:hypothetical protein